jgi:hypothetical protein
MTEGEFQLAVASVRKSIETSPLRWILKEVDETLRLGKPALRTVLAEKEESPDTLHLHSVLTIGRKEMNQGRRKTTVPTTEPYSKKEELSLLTEAIERTAIAALDMQSYVTKRMAIRGEAAMTDRGIFFERDGVRSSPFLDQTQNEAKLQIDGHAPAPR